MTVRASDLGAWGWGGVKVIRSLPLIAQDRKIIQYPQNSVPSNGPLQAVLSPAHSGIAPSAEPDTCICCTCMRTALCSWLSTCGQPLGCSYLLALEPRFVPYPRCYEPSQSSPRQKLNACELVGFVTTGIKCPTSNVRKEVLVQASIRGCCPSQGRHNSRSRKLLVTVSPQ